MRRVMRTKDLLESRPSQRQIRIHRFQPSGVPSKARTERSSQPTGWGRNWFPRDSIAAIIGAADVLTTA